MTSKEKHSFLLSLQSRLTDLIAETEAEIDADDTTDVEVFELEEHAKDALAGIEDLMAGIELISSV